MSNTHEQLPAAPLTLQAALLELARPIRPPGREVNPEDLPMSFEFTQAALDYGYMQTERGVHIFRELGRPAETRFTYRIDSKNHEFVIAQQASDFGAAETFTQVLENGVTHRMHTPAEVTRDEAKSVAVQEIRMLFHELFSGNLFGFSESNISAINAHTHPPAYDTYKTPSGSAPAVKRVLDPLNASTPSHRDILLAASKSGKPQLVFSPGGFSILVVPTDRTPVITNEQRLRKEQELSYQMEERAEVATEYAQAVAYGTIGTHLEAALRDMYRDQPGVADIPAVELFARNLRYIASGDPHAVLYNPVMHVEMQQTKALIEEYGAVGYYNVQATGNLFSRFTNWTA